MKLEYFILFPKDNDFCNTKEAFVKFLNVDTDISVDNQKIKYKDISANFYVETGIVKSQQESYFLVTIEHLDETSVEENLIDDFSALGEKIKQISLRIKAGHTIINTLWDDVGRIYAEKAYPLINEIENLMRKLISKLMLIDIGKKFSRYIMHDELFKKIEEYKDEELYVNDIYKVDFIHLEQILFKKKRHISLEELDRVLCKTDFNEDDKSKIRKYIPSSIWENHFSSIMEEKDKNLQEKWKILYDLRNKVAHNRYLKKEDFKKIQGICLDVREIINRAINKLGEINLSPEDSQSIIDSYLQEPVEWTISERANALGYTLTTKQAMKTGKIAAALYRSRYGYGQEPIKREELFNDHIRLVNIYTQEDLSILDQAIFSVIDQENTVSVQ